jgi:hypothetical protein
MILYGKKFAAHPVFSLTAGMPQSEVLNRIGAPTETKTSAELMTEWAGPNANLDLSKVRPEEYWSYASVPPDHHVEMLIRDQQLVEVLVHKDGSNETVVRIDGRGIAAARNYRTALHARRL